MVVKMEEKKRKVLWGRFIILITVYMVVTTVVLVGLAYASAHFFGTIGIAFYTGFVTVTLLLNRKKITELIGRFLIKYAMEERE